MSNAGVNSKSEVDITLKDQFVEAIAAFSHIPVAVVAENLDEEFENMGSLVAIAWNEADPKTPEEIDRFYQTTDSYIYNLAADHCSLRRKVVWDIVIRRISSFGKGLKILVFGDGIGTDSITLARLGHQVSYFDLPGKTREFARFRFSRESLAYPITVIEKRSEIPIGQFDVVVCIEVLEHLSDPPSLMQDFHKYLRTGGIAVITESFACVGPEFPSHLPENLQYAGKTHRMMEAFGFANTFNNPEPTNYPMEFRKIPEDVGGSAIRMIYRLRRAGFTRWRRIKTR